MVLIHKPTATRTLAVATASLAAAAILAAPQALASPCVNETNNLFCATLVSVNGDIHPGEPIRFGSTTCTAGFITTNITTSDYEIIVDGTCASASGSAEMVVDGNWENIGTVSNVHTGLGDNWALVTVDAAYDDEVCGKIIDIGGPVGTVPDATDSLVDYRGANALWHFFEHTQGVVSAIYVTSTDKDVNNAVSNPLSDKDRGMPIITSVHNPAGSQKMAYGIANDPHASAGAGSEEGVMMVTYIDSIDYGSLLRETGGQGC